MSLTYTVLDSARTHLGDNQAMDWPDNDILPKLQEAHRELQLKLHRNGIPLLQAVTPVMTVPANTTMLDGLTGYPLNIAEPIWIFERQPGANNNAWVGMQPRSFIPQEEAGNQRLAYWCFQEQHTLVRPCTSTVEVQMRYRKFIPVPVKNTDDIGIILGETYLSFRTAALCLEQMENQQSLAVIRNTEAMSHLDDIVAANVIFQEQILPTRRKPYHRRRGNAFFWGY